MLIVVKHVYVSGDVWLGDHSDVVVQAHSGADTTIPVPLGMPFNLNTAALYFETPFVFANMSKALG